MTCHIFGGLNSGSKYICFIGSLSHDDVKCACKLEYFVYKLGLRAMIPT